MQEFIGHIFDCMGENAKGAPGLARETSGAPEWIRGRRSGANGGWSRESVNRGCHWVSAFTSHRHIGFRPNHDECTVTELHAEDRFASVLFGQIQYVPVPVWVQ
jgi:hypothetical protein